jgi:hypothetical protein
VKRFVRGRDLTSRQRDVWIIDFGTWPEDQAREYPVLYDLIRSRVKPHRDANQRASIRDLWWQFGWPRPMLRESLTELDRFIATSDTSKHRVFSFIDPSMAPDGSLTVIALRDAFHFGVLSSRIHVDWSLAAGGRLGAGNDPVYSKSRSFDPFPFPMGDDSTRKAIADLAERLDAHRKAALERDDAGTMTGMYNVVEKLRAEEPLTPKERKVHEVAACGVLRDLHDELDRLVADAYGWPWPMETEEILARLVALHDERVEEERRGTVRWLRPDYQIPRFGGKLTATSDSPERLGTAGEQMGFLAVSNG